MRGALLIGTIIAMAIMGVLHMKNTKAQEAAVQKALIHQQGMPKVKNLNDVPAAIGKQMNDLGKQQQDALNAVGEGAP